MAAIEDIDLTATAGEFKWTRAIVYNPDGAICEILNERDNKDVEGLARTMDGVELLVLR